MKLINKKILILFFKKDDLEKIIKKIKNKKILKINTYLNIKKYKKNNLILLKKDFNNIYLIKKYIKKCDEVFIFINPEIKNIKKIYLLLNNIEKNNLIIKNKIKIYLEKNNKKIYYLIIKKIFKKYKIIIINRKEKKWN